MKTHKVSKRQYLDNLERDWTRAGLWPLTQSGDLEPNNAHEVTRVSPDELIIVTTSGRKIRFIVR